MVVHGRADAALGPERESEPARKQLLVQHAQDERAEHEFSATVFCVRERLAGRQASPGEVSERGGQTEALGDVQQPEVVVLQRGDKNLRGVGQLRLQTPHCAPEHVEREHLAGLQVREARLEQVAGLHGPEQRVLNGQRTPGALRRRGAAF